MQSRGSVIRLTGSVRPMHATSHKADLPAVSPTSHFSAAEQTHSAIALLRDAILPDGIARIDHLLDEKEFFIDGAGI
jgi:hypothetical protein